MKMRPFVEGYSPGPGARTWMNGSYQVIQTKGTDNAGAPMTILSIRREDRKPIMKWRDVQWIKNQLLGPEVEGVYLFPKESRLVDTSNQYYVFAYDEPGFEFPFGFTTRTVSEGVSVRLQGHGASVQEPFEEHVRPPDLEEQEEKIREEIIRLNESRDHL